VAAVSFVGSTPVAQEVYRSGTNAGKRVQALGGAKNHMVVLPDADLDVAADSAVSAGYGSAGERCMAVSVVVAVGGIGDELVAKIAERTRGLRIGPGDQDTSDMGPLITAAHRDKVASYLPTAREQGATVVLDGTAEPIGPAGAHFLGASLLDDVTPEMDAYRDEIFGPVLSVVRTDTFAEAMQLVNSSPWGNGAAVFTSDGAAARRFEMEVQAGMVGVNVPIPVPVAYHSFGGWKGSLFGDHHIYGSDSVHFYTRGKVVTSRWVAPRGRGLDLAFPSDAATIA
jgi:malonate-semialdehyde dehydrogenase (acetylating)/methylmalonate-semialdehyde dehydrogenase